MSTSSWSISSVPEQKSNLKQWCLTCFLGCWIFTRNHGEYTNCIVLNISLWFRDMFSSFASLLYVNSYFRIPRFSSMLRCIHRRPPISRVPRVSPLFLQGGGLVRYRWLVDQNSPNLPRIYIEPEKRPGPKKKRILPSTISQGLC